MAQIPVELVDEGIAWPAWISAGTAVATLVIVGITVWYARKQLRDATRSRHAQLATELIRHWTEPSAVEARGLYGWGRGEYSADDIEALVIKLFGPPGEPPTEKERADWNKLALWANQVEFLGMLVSQQWITTDVVYGMWGGGIQTSWKAWGPAVKRLREYDEEPDTYQHFEEVAREMQRIGREREGTRKRAASASGRGPAAGEAEEPQRDVQSTAIPPLPAVESSTRIDWSGWTLLVGLITLSALVRWFGRTKDS